MITIGALGEGELIESELLHVSEATARRLFDYQLEKDDVVFSRVADVGRSAVIQDDQRGWIMSSNLMRISLDQSKVRSAYLQAQFGHDYRVRQQIRTRVNSGGRDVANSNVLNSLLFAWPIASEQDALIERFEAVDLGLKRDAGTLAQLRLSKQGLMHDLLTGRVRVLVKAAVQSREASSELDAALTANLAEPAHAG